MDLVLLVADKDTEWSLRGILKRPEALGIRPLRYNIYVHLEHDPGCRLRAHDFLRTFVRTHDRALVMFDREGSGRETASRAELEQEVEDALSQAGWAGRAAAIVTDPELEAWVWSASPHVDKVLGWVGRNPDLRRWLQQRGFLSPNEVKPARPKEAMRAALRAVNRPPSSLFELLAKTVSLSRCTDPAFLKLTDVLQQWFSVQPGQS